MAVNSLTEALLEVNVGTTITESSPAGFSLQSITCTVIGAGAVCPAGLTIASLIAGVAVATLPPTGALQFAYICNVN